MEDIKLGDRVKVIGKNSKGEVAFIGETHFSDGVWLGIILDDAKGRHNGSVDGTRYFKCPRNHGVFVRTCQIEMDSLGNADDKDKVSKKHTYPNYLKSYTKSNKCTPSSKILETAHKSKSRTKIDDSQIENLDTSLSSSKNDETLDMENVMNKIREENEDLKLKLKSSEETVEEALEKYNTATEDIKNLTHELNNLRKELNAQKYYLKLLKKKKMKNDKNGELNASTVDDLNSSDDELDAESMKNITFVQRISELEEQNRIMVEGLTELRDFLKSTCQNQSRNAAKNAPPINNDSSIFSQREARLDLPPQSSELTVKNYGDMFREMIEFCKIMNKKEPSSKPPVNVDDTRHYIAGDNSYINRCHTSDKNVVMFKNKVQEGSENFLELPSFNIVSEGGENSLNIKQKSFQQYYQRTETSKREQLQRKFMQLQYRSMSSDTTNAVKELKNLISDIMPSSETGGECTSKTSLIQQELFVEVQDSERSSVGLNNEAHHVALPSHKKMNDVIQCNGDSGLPLIPSKRQNPPKRLLVSTRVYERHQRK